MQLYNRHQPLTAWTFWKTGIFLGIAHAAIVYFVIFFSTRKNGAHTSRVAIKHDTKPASTNLAFP